MTVDGVNAGRPTPGQVRAKLHALDSKDGVKDGKIKRDIFNEYFEKLGYKAIKEDEICISDALIKIADETEYDDEFKIKLKTLAMDETNNESIKLSQKGKI